MKNLGDKTIYLNAFPKYCKISIYYLFFGGKKYNVSQGLLLAWRKESLRTGHVRPYENRSN